MLEVPDVSSRASSPDPLDVIDAPASRHASPLVRPSPPRQPERRPDEESGAATKRRRVHYPEGQKLSRFNAMF